MSNFDGNRGERRAPGRPKGASKRNYFGKCDVRLTEKEDAMLSQLADRNDVTRSDVMRKALKEYYKFNTDGGHNI